MNVPTPLVARAGIEPALSAAPFSRIIILRRPSLAEPYKNFAIANRRGRVLRPMGGVTPTTFQSSRSDTFTRRRRISLRSNITRAANITPRRGISLPGWAGQPWEDGIEPSFSGRKGRKSHAPAERRTKTASRAQCHSDPRLHPRDHVFCIQSGHAADLLHQRHHPIDQMLRIRRIHACFKLPRPGFPPRHEHHIAFAHTYFPNPHLQISGNLLFSCHLLSLIRHI